MSDRRRRVAIAAATLGAGLLAVICNHHPVPKETPSLWNPSPSARPKFLGLKVQPQLTVLDGGAYSSGPKAIQYVDCSGCLPQLTTLQQALNVQVGLGTMSDGGYASTPAPSYYLDGAIALLPDGGYFAPTTDESAPIANPVIANRYLFPILDRDYPTVAGLLDAGLLDAALPAPTVAIDVTWSSQLLPDGGVLLPDGGVTSVAALTDSGAVTQEASVGIDSGIHIEAGGSLSLGDH